MSFSFRGTLRIGPFNSVQDIEKVRWSILRKSEWLKTEGKSGCRLCEKSESGCRLFEKVRVLVNSLRRVVVDSLRK